MTRKFYFGMLCSLFIFAACNSNKAPDEQPAQDSSAITSPDTIPTAINKTSNNNDTLVVRQFIRDSMRGWSTPGSSTWEKYWYERYKKKGNTVYRVQSDFDGNGEKDYAFILKDSSDQYVVWAFLKQEDTYAPYRIYDITRLPGRKLHVGLGVLPAGTYNDLNTMDTIPAKVQTAHPAIHVVFFETAAKAYYWKDGRFHLIQTGD